MIVEAEMPVMNFKELEDFMEGQILLIDKPLEWTSFDVVNKVRGHLRHALKVKKIKVGHAGTLDPLATGVLVVCTGKATKRIETLQAQDKSYTATIRLGAHTPCLDAELPVETWADSAHLTPDRHRTSSHWSSWHHRTNAPAVQRQKSQRPKGLRRSAQGRRNHAETRQH